MEKISFFPDWEVFNLFIFLLIFKTCSEIETKFLGFSSWENRLLHWELSEGNQDSASTVCCWGPFNEHACVLSSFSHVWLFATLWTIARQAPLSKDFQGKNIGVDCHVLLQEISPTQGSNLHLLKLLHCRQISLPLSLLRSPQQVGWSHIFTPNIDTCCSFSHSPFVVIREISPFSSMRIFPEKPKDSEKDFLSIKWGNRGSHYLSVISKWNRRLNIGLGIPGDASGKETACQCRIRRLLRLYRPDRSTQHLEQPLAHHRLLTNTFWMNVANILRAITLRK